MSGVISLCISATEGRAQTYTILHTFTGDLEGGGPWYSQLVVSSNTLYGTTTAGGSNGKGTVFKLNTDGTSYTVLKNFTGTDGSCPAAGVIFSGSTLYGTTEYGGSNGCGTIFKVNTDGNGYAVLKSFTGSDGREPCGSLVLSGANLYGTTSSGGDFGGGTIFKIGTNGDDYTLLKSFDFSSDAGSEPIAGLTLSDNVLYGTTANGSRIAGSVFRINTDGSGFMVLCSGGWPISPVVVSGSVLYGTTDWGGGYGTVFRVNTDGTDFTVLKAFTGGSDGAGVEAGLLLLGPMLYGTTYVGGDYPYTPPYYGHGTVFCINTNGSGFIVLKTFTGVDGANPRRGLTSSGTILFGMTDSGGRNGYGVIYSLSVAPPSITPPLLSQTVEAGCSVEFGVDITNSFAVTCTWLFEETNVVGCGTNYWLELTNCDFSQSGSYTVVASNIFGAVTSAPAMLNVIPVVERHPVPGLKVTGETGSSLNVEHTESLSPAPNWLPLDTVNLTNPLQYWFDITMPLPPERFYRAWQSGTPAVVPSLNLNFVPAITLNGNISDKLRLDCINQIGPTDAWVTLDTVTLTNTSQLYFDTSAVGQPARLYRIVPAP
jgi:uncharacterized repeat protein (TIGR03803 family)